MKTLLIKDLSITAELDSKAMAAVLGGTSKGYTLPAYVGGQFDISKTDFNATQALEQCQNTVVNNGNNVAYSCDISACVDPHQTGKNTINFK